ncbi:ABC transporter permease [Microbacterium mangrovi]|uniref:ABC transporter permease n=1 Tax=Microbacterium mangrovi TaxID=1348253 RepID=A0A0B2A7G9_9MICO|nr:ABC transporter permease [Microbacterium mangrovi]
MIRIIALRLVRLVITMLVCSFVVYGALYLAPGGAMGAITGGRILSKADQAEIVRIYHLNEPFLQRYFAWLQGLFTGDFGISLVSREPVVALIEPRLVTTAMLVGYSGMLIIVLGVGIGLFAALRGGASDRISVMAMSGLAAVPAFLASSILLFVFAVSLGWFPSFGAGGGFVDRLYHLTLPAVALALASIGYVGRISRASFNEEKNRDHVQTAVSRGLPRRSVIGSHILRNSLVPIATSVGITIAGLIAGSVVVEQVFAVNGLGSLLIKAVDEKDFAVVQIVTLVLVAGFVIVNTIVDLLYPLLDPRIRKAATR